MGSIDPKDLPIESTFYYNERSALFIYTVLFDAYNTDILFRYVGQTLQSYPYY